MYVLDWVRSLFFFPLFYREDHISYLAGISNVFFRSIGHKYILPLSNRILYYISRKLNVKNQALGAFAVSETSLISLSSFIYFHLVAFQLPLRIFFHWHHWYISVITAHCATTFFVWIFRIISIFQSSGIVSLFRAAFARLYRRYLLAFPALYCPWWNSKIEELVNEKKKLYQKCWTPKKGGGNRK